jgi:hypothetical protein
MEQRRGIPRRSQIRAIVQATRYGTESVEIHNARHQGSKSDPRLFRNLTPAGKLFLPDFPCYSGFDLIVGGNFKCRRV